MVFQALEALDSETRTAGLGFVDQESAGCTNRGFEAEESGNIADSELNCSEDRNVAVLEAMKVDNEQDDCIHLKTSGHENFRFTPRTKKNRRGTSIENSSVEGRNAGYLSIGGLKVFTEAGINFSDESEDFDEEFDARRRAYSSSGKNLRKQAKRGSRVYQRGQWLEDTFSGSGESIVDSSDSDIDVGLVEDYMANVEGADEMLDASWLLKNKIQHVAVEDMGSDDSEDEDEDNTSTETSDLASSDSGSASPGGTSTPYFSITESPSVTSWMVINFRMDCWMLLRVYELLNRVTQMSSCYIASLSIVSDDTHMEPLLEVLKVQWSLNFFLFGTSFLYRNTVCCACSHRYFSGTIYVQQFV